MAPLIPFLAGRFCGNPQRTSPFLHMFLWYVFMDWMRGPTGFRVLYHNAFAVFFAGPPTYKIWYCHLFVFTSDKKCVPMLRPCSDSKAVIERNNLFSYYRSLRDQDWLQHFALISCMIPMWCWLIRLPLALSIVFCFASHIHKFGNVLIKFVTLLRTQMFFPIFL